jgi:phosphoadenosine phosphosulfate reductase
MVPNPKLPDDPERLDGVAEQSARAEALEARYGSLEPQQVIERALAEDFDGGVAAVSSFGADSAVLLDLIARVDRSLPILFLDTGKHFGETLEYRDALVADLGLSDVRIIHPLRESLDRLDPDGKLHQTDTDACCDIRKVEPMARAVEPFGAWLTGRKRFQAATRAGLPVFEAVGPRIRINPLARWTTSDLADYMRTHKLRENPLVAYGYLSIGCFPCTEPVKPGEDARSGRWAGQAKTECGIHLPGLEQSLSAAPH